MFKTIAVVGAAALSLISVPTSAAAASAPPEVITVDVATVNGSGCPKDSAAVAVSHDNTAFTVTYSQFIAEAGPDSPATHGRRNCQLGLRVHIPQGYTYAITKADFRGYADLHRGATGLQRSSYYVQGSSRTFRADKNFESPMADNWTVTNQHDMQNLVWAPCGETRQFNVNTELRVNAKDSQGTSYLTMDSTDGSIRTLFNWTWKRC
jgi:hypothetical protein